MGLLRRWNRRTSTASGEDARRDIDEVEAVRRALLDESRRIGRSTGLSLTMLLEHGAPTLRDIDLYAVLAHLEAEGEITNLQQPSDGNMRFDLTERPGAQRRDRHG